MYVLTETTPTGYVKYKKTYWTLSAAINGSDTLRMISQNMIEIHYIGEAPALCPEAMERAINGE